MASPPTRVKPDIAGEATGIGSQRTFRGGWGQRAGIDPAGVEARATNVRREDIPGATARQETERPVVAEKRGNAQGAKGPH